VKECRATKKREYLSNLCNRIKSFRKKIMMRRLMHTAVLAALCLLATFTLAQEKRSNRILSRVKIPSGKYVIDGLLVMPDIPSMGAVIFLGGSGEWEIVDAYLKNPEESYGALMRFYIEDSLLNKGFAVLYTNKRGLGLSTGKWKKSGLDGRADDALAAFEFLCTHPRIDRTKIGMAGHSQGGWVAQIAAARNSAIAFIVNFAGPAMSVYDQTLLNDEQFYNCEGLTDQQKKKKRRMRRLELGLGSVVGRLIGGEAGHWARMSKHKTGKVLPRIQVPTLFLFAQHDIFVPPAQNIEYLNKLFPHGLPSYFEIYTQDGIDHSFHETDRPCLDWTYTAHNPYAKNLRDYLTGWILSKTDKMYSSQHP
jgi:uncharacterized protein